MAALPQLDPYCLGAIKSFGDGGSAYEVLEIAPMERGQEMVTIRVLSTGEELAYPVAQLREDPFTQPIRNVPSDLDGVIGPFAPSASAHQCTSFLAGHLPRRADSLAYESMCGITATSWTMNWQRCSLTP